MKEKTKHTISEFILVYGWSLAAAIIAIGTLTYFEVFQPEKYSNFLDDSKNSTNLTSNVNISIIDRYHINMSEVLDCNARGMKYYCYEYEDSNSWKCQCE